jgi:mannitol/fructose-specific phosphotransferase system IIA component (Ntr-type)
MPPTTIDILSVFDEQRFIPSLRATTKAGVLKELAGRMADDEEIRHADVLLEALLAREKMGSTAIGKGVAIPHSRTLSVPNLKALIARSKKGVAWGAQDKKSVKLIFLVVAPPQERTAQYLPLLGSLVSACSLKKDRDAILKADTFEDVAAALEAAIRG